MRELTLKAKANFIGLAVMLFLGLSKLLSGVCGIISGRIYIPDWAVQLIYIFITVVSLVLPWLFLRRCAELPPKEARLACTPVKLPYAVRITGFFLFVTMLCNVLTAVLNNFAVFVFNYQIPEQPLLPSGAALVLCFINKCVLPAFLEELLFRGMIQQAFSVHGKKFALITASLIFCTVHFTTPAALPALFIMSLFLGLAAYASQSYTLPVLLHFVNNAAAFLQLYIQQRVDATSALAFGIITYSVFIAWGILSIVWFKTNGIKFPEIKNPPAAKRRKSYFEAVMTAPFFSLMAVMIIVFWAVRFIWG